jgi:hypothetical protein
MVGMGGQSARYAWAHSFLQGCAPWPRTTLIVTPSPRNGISAAAVSACKVAPSGLPKRALGATVPPRHHGPMPPRIVSTDDLNAMIERVTPDVLALLADGVPRRRYVIVAALADRHPKQDVQRVIARLAGLDQLKMRGSRYTLPTAEVKQG